MLYVIVDEMSGEVYGPFATRKAAQKIRDEHFPKNAVPEIYVALLKSAASIPGVVG
jgi:hypothetical protein